MKYNVIIKQRTALLLVFFIINIDARSQQLLYNTGRTALIVHNVQGVVLSFDFSCVSVFVDVLCFIHVNLWELLGGDLPPTNSSKGEILCVAFKRTKLYLVVAYM